MAYDEELAERIRAALADRTDVSERKMFGGLTFMLRGNMCCGVEKENLMVRVGPDAYDEALAQPGARLMDFTGRPMKGMVFVGPEGYESDDGLAAWVERGVAFALSLPAK
ncbi:MAG: TfoX/Sxy family protein [Chloroflexi bacterium]|nr:TfoX/Sxy family protein [Chloroflexota bacterium]